MNLLDKFNKGYGLIPSIGISILYLIFLCGMVFVAYKTNGLDFDINTLGLYSKKIIINILLVFIGFYIW
jgi:hypothetical protein